MAGANHSNISPAAVRGDVEKCTRPSPSSFDPSHLLNEPAKQNYRETSNFVDEVLQFSDDIAENSAAENLELSYDVLIKNHRCKNSSYLKQMTLEKTHESVHTSVLIESTEQKHESIKRAAPISNVDGDQSLVCSHNENQDYWARALEPPLDVKRNSQLDDKRLGDDEGCSTGTTRKLLNNLSELNYHDIESVKNLTQKTSTEEQTEVQQNVLQQIQVEVFEELSSKQSEKNHLSDSEFAQNNPAGVDVIQEFEPHFADCSLDDVLKLPFVEASNSDNQLKSFVEDSINKLKTPIKRSEKYSNVDRDQSLVCSHNENQDRALEPPLDVKRNSQIDDKRLGDDEGCSTGTTRKLLNNLSELNYHDIESVKNLTQKTSTEEQTEVQQNVLQQTQVEVSEELLSKQSEKNHLSDSEFAQNNLAGVDVIQEFEPHFADCSLDDVLKLPFVEASNSDNQLKSFVEDSINELKTPIKRSTKYSKQVNCQASKSRRKKYILRSLGHTDRALRSRTQRNATASKPSNPVSSVRCKGDGKGRKKERRKKTKVADEFSKIRNCLRYFLNRMAYEQSFIAAYSGEGWKGYSLEKLKPEKELQRSTSEIMRRKLKIRDLFKHLDSLCVNGRFPESLFDSEGQIDSEDIFCAICGFKEMSANNDIVLCDGACDRGFHQLCLDPPLLNEDIPPDDDGWLCPGCDCKVDCIDLLNDAQGTNYSVTDSWENIYPEAAVVAAGQSHDLTLGLPSDDSDDNDFDPHDPDTDEQGDESSPVVSDNNIENEKLVASPKNNQYLGLPSDDSDDDDYNPGALDTEEMIKSESSSSDFTSDSENLAAIFEDDRPSRNDDDSVSSSDNNASSPIGIDKKSCTRGLGKRLLNDELSSLLNLEPLNDGLSPIASRRHVERLDYKKLHDETYGSISSDSSDDDDWNDIAAPRKKSCRIVSTAEQIGNSSLVKKGRKVMGKNNVKGKEITSERSAHRRLTVDRTNDSPIKVQEGSSKSCSTGRRAKPSAYSKLGEAVIQRLHISFEENQYPEKHTKESLAQDLGLSFKQVSKWFENTRWSTRHPTNAKANGNTKVDKSESPPNKVTPVSRPTRELKPELDPSFGDATHNSAHLIKSPKASAHLIKSPKASVVIPQCQSGDTKDGILVGHKITKQEPNSIKSRKRKGRSGDLAIDIDVSKIETRKPFAESSEAHEGQASDRIRTRKQKMIASDTDVSAIETRKLRSGSKKANEDLENHRIRTRRQKLIA